MTTGTITQTGLGSGLDIEALVTGLVNAERAPAESKINRQESQVTALISALGELNSVVSGVQSSASALADRSTYERISASSDQFGPITLSATSEATPASYDVEVSTLASKQSLASGAFASEDTVVGSGTLTIDVGTPTYSGGDPVYSGFSVNSSVDITIAANSTLTDVKNAINGADAGVEASIVKDGNDFRLLLVAKNTGVENSIQLTTDDADTLDTDTSGLSALAFNSAVSNLTQSNAATDAEFSINGLALTSATNEVNEVVTGLSLTLKETTDSPVRVTVAENRGAITDAISSFVSSYNSYVEKLNAQTTFNPTTGFAGPLVGDFSARTVESALRRAVTSPIDGGGSFYDSLAAIGITTTSEGTLQFDSGQLNDALDADKQAVIDLFAGSEDGSVQGVAQRITSALDGIIDPTTGLLPTRSASLTDRLDDFADQRDALARRVEKIEARYRAQFNALDILVSQLNTTSDFLQAQLASLPLAQKPDN
jgi:flagellar hook-associated protein 2